MKINLNSVKGTNDYKPKEAKEREIIRQQILRVYQNNGFQLIKTPILEHLELLNNSEGGENLRLIFKTIKRGNKLDLSKSDLKESDIAEEGLRYDLTVPLARFYSKNREALPTPFKSIQIDESFRAERPQLGRSREFMQCDIDIFGEKTEIAEIELLSTALEAYAKLGFKSITIRISDKRILTALMNYAGIAQEFMGLVAISIDKLSDIGEDGILNELKEKNIPINNIKKLISAIKEVKAVGIAALKNYNIDEKIINEIENIINSTNKIAKLSIEAIKIKDNKNIDSSKFNIIFDITIVRGQGYYTGSVYEAYTEGFSRAIGGGGRYDKMVEKLTGQATAAVGFSIGFEPICMLLKEQQALQPTRQLIALFYDDDDTREQIFAQKEVLKLNNDVSIFKYSKNMRNTLDKLKQNGFNGYSFCKNTKINKL